MGSSGWSPGLWWGSNSLGDPRFVKLCGKGPCHPGDSHKKPCCEHDQGEGDRCPGNALGKCLGGLSFDSLTSYRHSGNDKVATGESDPSEYNEVVTTKDTKTIDAFSSHVIHVRMGTSHTGEGINVVTQALCTEDGSLLQGLTVQSTYMELCSSSRKVAVVVRNSMAYPPDLEEKDYHSESSCSHASVRATYMNWCDRGIGWNPRLPNAQIDCEVKTAEIVQGAGFK